MSTSARLVRISWCMRQRSVIAFSGHLTDAPGRAVPRFPERLVPEVRKRIHAALARQRQPLHGVSSAARGGDLLFLEELLALGGTATVLLPFVREAFMTASVGQGWDAKFVDILRNPAVELRPPLLSTPPEDDAARDAAFEACNVSIADVAEELAKRFDDADPLFLALYQQTDSDRQGGTLHAFSHWTSRGHRLQLIAPQG